MFWFMGQADDWAIMPLIGIFFPLLLCFQFETMRLQCGNTGKALAAAALVGVLPVFVFADGPAYAGYADTPLAMLFLLAFGCTLLWRETRDLRLLLLAVFLSGLLPLTKNEGLWLAGLNLLLAAVPGRRSSPRSRSQRHLLVALVSSLALLIAILLPWFLLRERLAPGYDLTDISTINTAELLHSYRQVPTVLGFFVKALLGFQPAMSQHYFAFGLFWVLFLVSVLIAAWCRHGKALLLAGFVAAFFMIIAAAYFTIPTATPTSFMTRTFFRLCFSIIPVAALQSDAVVVAAFAELEHFLDLVVPGRDLVDAAHECRGRVDVSISRQGEVVEDVIGTLLRKQPLVEQSPILDFELEHTGLRSGRVGGVQAELAGAHPQDPPPGIDLHADGAQQSRLGPRHEVFGGTVLVDPEDPAVAHAAEEIALGLRVIGDALRVEVMLLQGELHERSSLRRRVRRSGLACGLGCQEQ
ncbi:MAG: hypothetical protein AB1486_12730 [Planctomycetota bacterium]